MLSVAEARARILAPLRAVPSEVVALPDAWGRVLAKPVVARLSPATATALGLVVGTDAGHDAAGSHLGDPAHDVGSVTVSTDTGSLTLPVVVTEMPDGVVWAPTNARGVPLRALLGAAHGSVVRIARFEAPASVLDADAGARPVEPAQYGAGATAEGMNQ